MTSMKDHIASVVEGLREELLRSPLMDGRRYMQDIEAAYRKMWQAAVQK